MTLLRFNNYERTEQMENREICHCMGISYEDIYNAMNSLTSISDAADIMRQLQEKTSCGTGCGKCRNEILNLISDILNGYADPPHHHHHHE